MNLNDERYPPLRSLAFAIFVAVIISAVFAMAIENSECTESQYDEIVGIVKSSPAAAAVARDAVSDGVITYSEFSKIKLAAESEEPLHSARIKAVKDALK